MTGGAREAIGEAADENGGGKGELEVAAIQDRRLSSAR